MGDQEEAKVAETDDSPVKMEADSEISSSNTNVTKSANNSETEKNEAVAGDTTENTGLGISFQTLEMSYLRQTHLKIFVRKFHMEKSIIPSLSENFNEIKQTWHQLQPQT